VPKLSEEQRFARLVAEHLVFRRLKLGLSKLALAQKAGLDQRTITFIENGVNVPSLVTLFMICKALGLKAGAVVSHATRGRPPGKRAAPVAAHRPRVLPAPAKKRATASRKGK
jgi:DNA-binding XRE family transcriptional regulator